MATYKYFVILDWYLDLHLEVLVITDKSVINTALQYFVSTKKEDYSGDLSLIWSFEEIGQAKTIQTIN